jgi:hypothetical protein
MAVNYPTERTSPAFNYSSPVKNAAPSRHFDSFIVRLWQDEGSDSMLRVEVQHVQAGLSIEAVQVPLDWIVPGIMGCLQSPMIADSNPSRNSDDAN